MWSVVHSVNSNSIFYQLYFSSTKSLKLIHFDNFLDPDPCQLGLHVLPALLFMHNFFFVRSVQSSPPLRPVSPVIGGWTVPAMQDFWWSGEPFDVRMPFMTTTTDAHVGARTFNFSVKSPTRNLYTTASPATLVFLNKIASQKINRQTMIEQQSGELLRNSAPMFVQYNCLHYFL